MAWKAPDAASISRSLRDAVRAELPAADAFVWPSNLAVTLKVFAQALRGLYLRLEWLRRQKFVTTADTEALEQHGADIGIARLPASLAAGSVTATTVAGTVIPNGRRMVRADGVVYVSTATVTATGTSTTIPVRALEAGKAGNLVSGTALTLESPLTGVTMIVVGSAGLTGGADEENDASLRERILHAKRNVPHGGSPAEYVRWARLMPGVTRVYVKRATPAAGSVTVLFMMDDTYANGIPASGDVVTMAALLQANAPSNAAIVVTAPTAKAINVTVNGLVPNDAATRDAVRTEILAMFRRRAEPGTAAADFTFSKSWIAEAVSMAAGEDRHRLTAPSDDVACGDGEVAVLGTLSFT